MTRDCVPVRTPHRSDWELGWPGVREKLSGVERPRRVFLSHTLELRRLPVGWVVRSCGRGSGDQGKGRHRGHDLRGVVVAPTAWACERCADGRVPAAHQSGAASARDDGLGFHQGAAARIIPRDRLRGGRDEDQQEKRWGVSNSPSAPHRLLEFVLLDGLQSSRTTRSAWPLRRISTSSPSLTAR